MAVDFEPIQNNTIDFEPVNTGDKIDFEPIKENSNPTVQGMVKQAGIGFGNSLLAGFPLFATKKFKGENVVKDLESQVPQERIARGVGTTIGTVFGLPKYAFLAGMKIPETVTKMIVGAEKANNVNRFVKAASKGASGFATTDLLSAPENDFKEKSITVPTSALFGAATFGVGEKFAPQFRKFLESKGLINKGFISGTPELNKLNNVLNAGKIAEEDAAIKLSKVNPLTFETQLVDRLAPIRHIQESAQQVSGKMLSFNEKPYEAARLYSGIGGKVIDRFKELADVLNQDRKNIKPISQIFTAQRLLERSNRGFSNPQGIDAKASQKMLSDLEQALGKDSYNNALLITQKVRDITTKSLDDLLEAGVIDKQSRAKILSENQFYAPFEVISKISDDINFVPLGGKSFSVSKPGFLKGIEGTEKDINDPLSAVMRYIANSTKLAEKNKVLNKVVNLRNLDKSLEDKIFPITEKESIPAGFKKISLFKDGVREQYAVPDVLADTLKGLNSESIDLMTRFASFGTRALRSGATQLNLAFTIPNIVRDAQTASLISKVGFSAHDWARGFASALKKDDLYNQFIKSGASFSSPQVSLGRKIPANIEQLLPSPIDKAKNIVNPVSWINKISQLSEESTRIGVFSRGLRKGLPLEEAAFNARNSTIDFSKHGTVMNVANMWVPFLNARLQGTVNIFDKFKNNPAEASLIASGLVGLPLTATYMWNTTQFPDVWDKIPQYEKDNNFIMIVNRDVDSNNKFKGVLKIPKGDIGKILGNPVESLYEYMRGVDPDFSKVAISVLNEVSPIGITGQKVISSVTPPPLKALIEDATNKSLLSGRNIVPEQYLKASPKEQYTEKTDPQAILIGKLFNISPAKVENTIGSLFGGLGRAVLNPLESNESLTNRFIGSHIADDKKNLNILNDIIEQTENKDANSLRYSRQLFEQYKNIPNDNTLKVDFIKSNFKGKEKEFEIFKDLIEADLKGLSLTDKILSRRPYEDRIKYIKTIGSQYKTDEERLLLLKLMMDKKIITPEGLSKYSKKNKG